MTTYTPAEAARRSGFSIDTLRYYEREGILAPVARTPGGHRIYRDSDLSTLDFLRCLRDAGMPIERLRRYGELCRDPDSVADRVALLREHAAAVETQIDQLRLWQARVAEKIAWYEQGLQQT
ncbi:MerR family transcriptional regulator [Micromonospora sp. NPDC048871]|uniref:MerR family transcriptional regulator n=1 Tax=unclassified Micromonospora TaxID=2617518 RepID=UPI002E1468C0|nr:MerR family transcriptional regulator [Micromonospora sp. NBC_01739]